MSKFKGKKTDNGPKLAKKTLREIALNGIQSPSVLEFFCGSGESFRAVWHRAKNYTGVDLKAFDDERNTICGNVVDIAKTIDVDKYNIFDLDAYGSPYTVLDILSKRIKNYDKIAFVVTDGICIDLRMGNVCSGVQSLTGLKNRRLGRANVLHYEIIRKIIGTVAQRLNGVVSGFKIATGVTGAKVKYYVFFIERKK